MALNSYASRYTQQSVLTMTQGEMVVKLYAEVEKQLSLAAAGIKDGDIAGTNRCLQKSQRILRHLMGTLDMNIELSHNLYSLYDYFIRRTIDANVKKDVKAIEEILPMVHELKDAFAQAEKLSRIR